ncbi:MAG: nucleotidyl transferase AbiEii/AbiGii toxin family protein [Gammaproteobacteria bacterium]|nr:nucleotidyl transferase AbiEii/AbiGii toxin family protein [Gammaproteobacteria bacterium]
MDSERLKSWEFLFAQALELIDSVGDAGIEIRDWTFGGGTVLMRRHRHRFSKDIDIFIPDPQYLGYLTPRLNDKAESLTRDYIEQAGFLKLIFPQGEIDFVASAPLTQRPSVTEILLGRPIQVETSTEIVAKKLWHRGEQFTARDILDVAMVIEKEPGALHEIVPVIRDRRGVVMERITAQEAALREAFAELEILEYQRGFDECVQLLRNRFAECG